MLDHTYYVPVLRWKRGEYWVLANLPERESQQLVPLLEVVNESFAQTGVDRWNATQPAGSGVRRRVKSPPDKVMRKLVKAVMDNWGQAPIFLDLGLVDHNLFRAEQGEHLVAAFARDVNLNKLSVIPVTSLDRDANYQLAIKQVCATYERGLCIRLKHSDIAGGTCTPKLMRLVSTLGLTPSQVDLAIDHGYIGTSAPCISDCINALPSLQEWRSLIWLTGAFPKDLSQFWPAGQYEHPRSDWLGWRDQVMRTELARIPIYGDYTTQHGNFKEPDPNARPSASIRYTSEDLWVIMRGQGSNARKSAGRAQYPVQARLLCRRKEFMGRAYCEGDKFIEDISKQSQKTGSPESWLRATINHHITFVVRQLANLSETAAVDRLLP